MNTSLPPPDHPGRIVRLPHDPFEKVEHAVHVALAALLSATGGLILVLVVSIFLLRKRLTA